MHTNCTVAKVSTCILASWTIGIDIQVICVHAGIPGR